MLGFAFTEGSANDWIATRWCRATDTSETIGAIAFGFFVTAMTVGRWRAGRCWSASGGRRLRVAAGLALVGLLMVLVGGRCRWRWPAPCSGAAAALGFPVGMSAAADDPARAAARVSVVSSVGYTAFLAGPPLIGLLAESNGILQALFVVLGALVLGTLASGAAREQVPAGSRSAVTGTRRTPAAPGRPPSSGPG